METKTEPVETFERPLILRCWSDNEDYSANVEVALVECDKELLKAVRARCKLLQYAHGKDKSAYSLTFWDGAIGASDHCEVLEPIIGPAFDLEAFEKHFAAESICVPEVYLGRIDFCQMHVTESEVWWQFTIKHCERLELTTARFKPEELASHLETGAMS